MRALATVIAYAGLLLLAINLPTVFDAIEDFRTDITEQSYQVPTGVGETSANITFSVNLWDNNIANILTVSSNISEPTTANSYTNATRTLNVNGLTANVTRTLTVEYLSAALAGYTGAENFIKFFPTAYIFGLVAIAVISIVVALRGT